MMNTSIILQKRIALLGDILESQNGVISAFLALFIAFLSPDLPVFLAVGVAICVDGIFGTWVSVLNGKYVLSSLARQTFSKIASYLAVLILTIVFERLIHGGTAYTAKTVGALIILCEFWSFSGHALVIFPNSVFFKVFNKYLKGEIESKTGQKLE